LFRANVVGDQTEQLAGENEHVALGKTARAELAIDVLREDFDGARVGLVGLENKGNKSGRRRLRHFQFSGSPGPRTNAGDCGAVYPRMMPSPSRLAISIFLGIFSHDAALTAKGPSQMTAKWGVAGACAYADEGRKLKLVQQLACG